MAPSLSTEGPYTNTYDLPNGTEAEFETSLFYGDNGSAHLVLNRPQKGQESRVRLASECTLGQGGPASILCDCGTQLRKALQEMETTPGNNYLVYSFGRGYEGRGVGPVDHFRAYNLHINHKLSSSEAYRALGIPVDARQYGEPVQLLRQLGFDQKAFTVLTNSDAKVRPLVEAGLNVRREGIEVPVTKHNAGQLKSRIDGFRHEFSAATKAQVESMGVQLRTLEECQAEGIDLSVEPEHIADGVLRYGPVELPLAVNRVDDGVVVKGSTYLYVCNGRMYHVVTGSDHLPPEVEVAGLHACIPGDNFASTRCDCRRDLKRALGSLQSNGSTALVYALAHHSSDPHAKIPLDPLREHVFNGGGQRTQMSPDHPDVRVILESLGARSTKQLSFA